VEYNSACKNRIQSAQNAFNALDSESRKYVTRASELSAAVTKYQELETEAKNSYVVIPELTGMRVGTNYGGAYNQLVRSYPEFSTLKINFHTVTNSSYSDGQIAETDPPAGSVITKSGTLDVYISKR